MHNERMALSGDSLSLKMEGAASESRVAIMVLMSAIESMCKELAKLKAEVACITIFNGEVFSVGTDRGRAYADLRKDFQNDFINYCLSEEGALEQSVPTPSTAETSPHDADTLKKMVDDYFCICYGKALGKPGLVPVPYERIAKDPLAVSVQGLPDGVRFKDPIGYDYNTLSQIFKNKSRITFEIKRPFLETRTQKGEPSRKTPDNVEDVSSLFNIETVQVKAEAEEEEEGSMEISSVTIKEETEESNFIQFPITAINERYTTSSRMGSIIKDKNRSGKAAEEHLLDTRTCDILTYPIQSQKANGVRRKRIVLSIDDKLEIIQSLKQGTKASILAQRYGVGSSTISDIKKSEAQLQAFAFRMKFTPSGRKRKVMRAGDDQVLEEALYKWFLQQRLLGAPISGSLMIQKAKQLNSQINGSNSKFRASSRWLYNFKQRHGIRCQRIAREISASESWDFVKQNLNNIVAQKGLLREQVYTCDETGLAWRCLPLTGRDRPLDRVTLLACSNASGLHKLRLTLVGKTIKPRCFRNIDVTALPIRYVYENNGWMTCELFKDWFFSEFVPSVKDHLLDTGLPPKAVLVLDFAPCHPNGTYLQTDDSNFSCLFLPVDSMHQHPMAQGIIANFKMHFRLLLLQKVLSSTSSSGNAEKFMKLLSLKDAADLVAEAWEQVQPSTLKTAWDRLWPSNQESSDAKTSEDILPSTIQITSLVSQLKGVEQPDPKDIDTWLNVDLNDPGFELSADEEQAT
ncbi:jerky protein homolog-like isoform X4 [Erpetoichthys calabaricus]|uniref:jerky protein homolog-like isoform X4 n=1 Tax=Erpetoichthys calabaricus TaxID=27687 RepID=UPI00223471C3|nr:jerky protein homolog-like isoform X4 [Erpetoichthys calabaricus]